MIRKAIVIFLISQLVFAFSTAFIITPAFAIDCETQCDTNNDDCFGPDDTPYDNEDDSNRTDCFADCKICSSEGIGCGGGLGPIADFLCTAFKSAPNDDQAKRESVGQKLNDVFSMILGFLTAVASLWFMIQIVLAGYNWISAGGDKGKLEEAQKKILNSIIGLLIVIAAWIITGVLGTVFGLDILNPGSIIQGLGL